MCEISGSIHRWSIPRPPEDELAAYLALGWYEQDHLDGQKCLRWSFARGTPRFPGDEEPAIYPETAARWH